MGDNETLCSTDSVSVIWDDSLGKSIPKISIVVQRFAATQTRKDGNNEDRERETLMNI